MAFSKQIEQLVARLTDLTENGKVKWRETADEAIFLVPVAKFVVSVGKEDIDTWGQENVRFRVRVLDHSGKTLDDDSASSGEDFSRLGRLHELARRNALNVDEALTDLLSSLEHI